MRCNGKVDFRQVTERCTGDVRSRWSGGYRGCGWLVVLGKLALLAKPGVQRFFRPFLPIAANVKLIEIARSGGALENGEKYRGRRFLRDSFSNLRDCCCWSASGCDPGLRCQFAARRIKSRELAKRRLEKISQ